MRIHPSRRRAGLAVTSVAVTALALSFPGAAGADPNPMPKNPYYYTRPESPRLRRHPLRVEPRPAAAGVRRGSSLRRSVLCCPAAVDGDRLRVGGGLHAPGPDQGHQRDDARRLLAGCGALEARCPVLAAATRPDGLGQRAGASCPR
ncbi:hypothetical protein G5V59_07370 [Nocardioides sp. W3-2-3]|uniref:hypothetical protein n=1 Tax=Nocardioides convexus TaxID=2712224 RepID=UPI0024188E89|nr:hypothetical protein [Nocardioides convexus]NHA00064.1 hypothetical protein [Nocardioides convexus]